MTDLHKDASWRLLVWGLVLFSFFLGLPVFHYATAVMIALVIRNHEHPERVDLLELFSSSERGGARPL